MQETGNIASTLASGPSYTGAEGAAFSSGTSASPTNPACPALGSGGTFSIGDVCAYNPNFQPTIVGLNTADLVFTTTTAGGLTTSNTASLSGMGYTTLSYFGLVAISSLSNNPTTVNLGGTVELVLTAYNSNHTVAKDYVGTITFTTTDSTGLYFGGTPNNANTVTYNFTAADNGVLTIKNIPGPPITSGLQLNQYGIWTATATANPASLPPSPPANPANPVAVSNPIHVIEPATFTLTSSINPSAVNQSTTFTFTVTATGPSTVPPTGTVTFYSDGVQIGTPIDVTGSGAIATASLPSASRPRVATPSPRPTPPPPSPRVAPHRFPPRPSATTPRSC